jgi:hypothetical protein
MPVQGIRGLRAAELPAPSLAVPRGDLCRPAHRPPLSESCARGRQGRLIRPSGQRLPGVNYVGGRAYLIVVVHSERRRHHSGNHRQWSEGNDSDGLY